MNTGASASQDLGPQRGKLQRLGWRRSWGLEPPGGFFIWVWPSAGTSAGAQENTYTWPLDMWPGFLPAREPQGRQTSYQVEPDSRAKARQHHGFWPDLKVTQPHFVGHKRVVVLPQFKVVQGLQLGSQSMSETSWIFSKNKPLHHSIGNHLPSWLEASDGGGKM